ncbi:GPI transamidase subunit PIG-U [Flagelloscypha sp. PMI_526]|nr:GPI transamidase subunit PIG-U [Flagelloscypha sp. PMI_526]
MLQQSLALDAHHFMNLPPQTALLVLARYALTLTSFPETLKYDLQLSTPLSSFANLKEGIFLFENGSSPYAGGVFHHSPLLLSLFSTILPTSRTWAGLLWATIDALSAYCLVVIFRARQNVATTSRDWSIALMYIANPYILLSSLALSTTSIENLLLLLCVKFASRGKTSPALFTLAFLVHITLPALLIVAPTILLLMGSPTSQLASPRQATPSLKRGILLSGEFILYLGGLAAISTLVAGTFDWLPQTWGMNLTLSDLTPNPGLWWYFFTEMFDHFRPFFLMAFSIHLLMYIAPICIKFQYDPLYATFILTGIASTFSAYPTLSNTGLFISMLSIFPEIFPHLRYPIVTSLLHLHASLLMPLFYYLWTGSGTGNANFYYATTLVFACANGAALLDIIWAGLRIAIGKEEVEGVSVIQE